MSYRVYKHTVPNGKVYIGITSRAVHTRWRNGGNGYKKNKHFYAAIQKYGWENIKHEVLFEGLTKEQAEQKEIELIAEHKSNQREYGYNNATGGRTNSGYHISEERKKRISETLKKIYSTQKNPKYGKPLSEETKHKLSIANLGKSPSEETRRKISKANKGKQRTEETKRRIREREQSKVNNILQVDFNGTIINIFNSIQEASRITTVPANKICAVCKGKRYYSKGFIWLYEKDKALISERLKHIKRV